MPIGDTHVRGFMLPWAGGLKYSFDHIVTTMVLDSVVILLELFSKHSVGKSSLFSPNRNSPSWRVSSVRPTFEVKSIAPEIDLSFVA